MALGGLDIGTSGCKCTIMTEEGRTLAVSYRPYAVSRTAGGHEVDADLLWEAVQAVIQEAAEACREPVEALCATSFGESCVLLDREGVPLCPIMLYTDPRGGEESGILNTRMAPERIYRLTGHTASPAYFLPKLMWYSRHRPEMFAQVAMVLPVNAYIVYRLCGQAGVDYSLAARTMMLDIRRRDWCDEILAAADISRSILPPVVQTGTAVGNLRPDLASALGMSEHTRIVIGCHDQVAASIGAGAMRAGCAVNGSGTVECITPVFDHVPESAALRAGGFAIVPTYGELYATYAYIYTGGALLQWCREQFGTALMQQAEREGKSIFTLLDEQVKHEPTGMLVLPHFAGAATPYMDNDATGAVIGLTVEKNFTDLYQAMMEGICYESRVCLDMLREAGVMIDTMRATGGGSRSPAWNQMKADIWDVTLHTLSVKEAGTVGSVMLAGIATGAFRDLTEAMTIVRTTETFAPAPDAGRYAPFYARYRRVYNAVQQIQGTL